MYKGLVSRDGWACLRDWLQCDVGSERKQGVTNRWAKAGARKLLGTRGRGSAFS